MLAPDADPDRLTEGNLVRSTMAAWCKGQRVLRRAKLSSSATRLSWVSDGGNTIKQSCRPVGLLFGWVCERTRVGKQNQSK